MGGNMSFLGSDSNETTDFCVRQEKEIMQKSIIAKLHSIEELINHSTCLTIGTHPTYLQQRRIIVPYTE